MMGCARGQAVLRSCLLLLIWLQAGPSFGASGQRLGLRDLSSGHVSDRRLLQAQAPNAGSVGSPPPDAPSASPTQTPTPTPITTTAPSPTPATPPLTAPPPTTLSPPLVTAAASTPVPAPTDTLPLLLVTDQPAIAPAPETLPPVTPAPTTPPPTLAPTPEATLAPPVLTLAPTLAPTRAPATPPPGKATPTPTLVPVTPPTLAPTLAPTPLTTLAPPGKTPSPLTVTASAPAPALLNPVVTLAEPLSPPPANTSGAAPACLLGTSSCDPLVVKILLSNTDYPTLSQYLFSELSAQLGLQTNQFDISAVNAGSDRVFNVTFYILPVSQYNISAAVAANVTDALSSHKVTLDQGLFGNYTFFYAVPNSALEAAAASPLLAPAPAPLGVLAPAPSPANTTSIPPVNKSGGGGSSGIIIGVAAAVGGAVVLALCGLLLCCCLCRKKKVDEQDDRFSDYSKTTSMNTASQLLNRSPHKPLRTMSSQSLPSDSFPRPSSARVFTYEELAEATNGWDPLYLLGEGGFGKVYKGELKDGIKVAVKRLTVGGHQGDREFQVEVEMLSRLHHRHLVKLIGYYYRPDQQLLCYELVMNGSLENHLHGQGRHRRPPGAMWQPLQLDWDARMKIAIGAARGLAYLHEDCQPTVIHRDMKASNILLEDNFHAKVADFGLAKIAPDNRSDYLTTRVMGTFGYVAPEYAMTGHIMVKSDVYSYGVVLLELLTGRKPVDMSQPQGEENLVTWARPMLADPDRVEELVDPRLGDAFPFEDLLKVATIALACVHPDPARRPHMGEVVQKLRMLQRTPGADALRSEDSATGQDMEALASTLSGPLPAYTQSQPFPGGYMSTAYPPFPMHRSAELPPHNPHSTTFPSENLSRFSSESSPPSQAQMLEHDQLARTTVFSEGLEEGR